MMINWLDVFFAVLFLFIFCGAGLWFMFKWRYIQMTPTHPEHGLVDMLYEWLMTVAVLMIVSGVALFFWVFWKALGVTTP